MSRVLRTFLAALLAAALVASGTIATQAAANGAACPVHLALVSAGEPSIHHGHGHHAPAEAANHAHGSGHPHDSGQDDETAVPHFSFACCAACVAGLTATDTLLQAPGWLRLASVLAAESLEPGEIPSTDPPPRILL